MLKKICLLVFVLVNTLINYAQNGEKKVDYLENIYFSGKNKADTYDMILLTVSKMGSQFDSTMLPSPSFLKQYVYLKNISIPANAAKDACDVLDLIAVGIRDLDIDEAIAQKIKQPSAEATKNSADALAGVTKVNNAISSTNSALNTLAWSQYLISGNAVGFGALSKANGVTSAIGAGKQVFDAAKGLGLMKAKDKPCKDVVSKEIAIGEHNFTPAVQPTTADVKQFNANPPITSPNATIVISNINFSQLTTLTASIQKIEGISKVDNEAFDSNIATLKIASAFSLIDLVTKIAKVSTPLKLEVKSIDNKSSSGTLVAKL